MLKTFKQINKFGLYLSISAFLTAIICYEFTSISLIFISQLLISSIGSISIFSALNSIQKGHFKYKKGAIAFGYFSFLLFVFSIFETSVLTKIWSFQLASILTLLFIALDDRLDHTSFYNYRIIKFIFRIGAIGLVLLTLFKIDSSMILSFGILLLMILTLISLGSNFVQKKHKEEA